MTVRYLCEEHWELYMKVDSGWEDMGLKNGECWQCNDREEDGKNIRKFKKKE